MKRFKPLISPSANSQGPHSVIKILTIMNDIKQKISYIIKWHLSFIKRNFFLIIYFSFIAIANQQTNVNFN